MSSAGCGHCARTIDTIIDEALGAYARTGLEIPSQLRFPAVRSLQRTLGARFAHRLTAYGKLYCALD